MKPVLTNAKQLKIIPCTLTYSGRIKLDINSKRKHRNYTNT